MEPLSGSFSLCVCFQVLSLPLEDKDKMQCII